MLELEAHINCILYALDTLVVLYQMDSKLIAAAGFDPCSFDFLDTQNLIRSYIRRTGRSSNANFLLSQCPL